MSFKKGIIIAGHGSLGKTTLVGYIRDELNSRGAKETEVKKYPKDFISILKYKGKNILIISGGDNEYVLRGALDILREEGYNKDWLQKNIDLVLGAARTQGGTHTFWEKEISTPTIWLGKTLFKSNVIAQNQYLANIYTNIVVSNL